VKEKKSPDIWIKANEKEVSPSSRITLLKLKDLFKPNANIIIYSGFTLSLSRSLKQGYGIGLIQKGEIPSPEEFIRVLAGSKTYPTAYHQANTVLKILLVGKRKDSTNIRSDYYGKEAKRKSSNCHWSW
jgi:hypothetical protein